MLIKIDKGRYINSDQIAYISTDESGQDEFGTIWLTNNHPVATHVTIIGYIAQILDAHDALTTAQPQEMSLRSRLAVYLRNQSAGQSLNMLAVAFPETDKYSIEAALNELDANNVIHALGVNDNRLFYHATHAMFAGPPEEF